MNRFTRILTMAGLGLVTGVTMAAGPAMASTSSDQGASKSGSNANENRRNGDRLVKVFRTWSACDRAGEYGEDRGYWEDYDCQRIGGFSGRRGFALVVDYDNWGHGWSGNFPSSWGNSWRPYPGNWGPGWGGGSWGGGGWGGGGWGGGGWGGGIRPPFGGGIRPPFGGGVRPPFVAPTGVGAGTAGQFGGAPGVGTTPTR
ncbi:hypothetical protein BJ973_003257 [Actinoplanes tereljensis]|uniref:Uncharacterized protein n=1 Tax=Paractinoplanes tereljensis TaxID=571912 RepID=A0A919TZK7_9ACTN|nr:hypothetical protein [Actinoplanes tereljensis]GIF25987.1 hypothetical protein Ate02nite_87170 [Actinoplanes tereljensis]